MTTTLSLPKHLSVLEDWLPVPDTDGMYEVSDFGNLRTWINTRRERQSAPRAMSPSAGKGGYQMWCHRLHGKETRMYLHRTVALAFLGDPGPGRWEVRHLNNDKLDNRLANLAWGTAQENADDRVRAGTTRSGDQHHWSRLTSNDVAVIRRDARRRSAESMAAQFGVSKATIVRVVRRQTWKREP